MDSGPVLMLGRVAQRQGFWREPSGTPTSEAIALEAWVREAYDVLSEVATAYHAVITTTDLGERVQAASDIRTSRPPAQWLGKVLLPVAHLCSRNGEPPLPALAVDPHSGWVGEAYDDVLRVAERLPITDPIKRETHAAQARLECYRWAGSAPAGGGEPAPVPEPSGRRPRAARAPGATAAPRTPRVPKPPAPPTKPRIAASDRPVTVCDRCFMAVPATGLCDNCD
ncbi:hypothetical protein NSZ01_33250 [Nocardioides szechwanensis]|uniref:Uncharacterized protein n=1 Tax=Nocardioides szechwanensis TaxID=1005944 RepID=A0A1H0KYK8_9ACTN|nr:hypothetical protein NSZ01_33250 [Nocardioides szechwanensis]SDO61039.1 hypothetical protein SAMN05192576_0127 [Nocardioides szechwanensis]